MVVVVVVKSLGMARDKHSGTVLVVYVEICLMQGIV